MVRSEGNMSLKNPVTPPGIDPGTVRLVAQRLNHYATSGPLLLKYSDKYGHFSGLSSWSATQEITDFCSSQMFVTVFTKISVTDPCH
jgi:hypothetical protein